MSDYYATNIQFCIINNQTKVYNSLTLITQTDIQICIIDRIFAFKKPIIHICI